eukprot:15476056-Alexandrium_andersonii.AAC.1
MLGDQQFSDKGAETSLKEWRLLSPWVSTLAARTASARSSLGSEGSSGDVWAGPSRARGRVVVASGATP